MHRAPLEVLGDLYEMGVAAGLVAVFREALSQVPVRVGPWDPSQGHTEALIKQLSAGLSSRPDGWDSTVSPLVVACGHLHGQTVARKWLGETLGVRSLHVFVPAAEARGTRPTNDEIAAALGIPVGVLPRSTNQAGELAHTDLAVVARSSRGSALLVVECSLELGATEDGDPPAPDDHGTWLRLVNAAAWQRLRQGVFSQVRTEVSGLVGIEFPNELQDLNRTLVQRRGTSKLFQGCSYATHLAEAIARADNARLHVTVTAVTLAGIDHLSATCPAPNEAPALSWRVLQSAGALYLGYRATSANSNSEQARSFDVRALLRRSFGPAQKGISPDELPPGAILDYRVEESLASFPRVHERLNSGELLRDRHAAEIRNTIKSATPGKVTVAFLAGAPGIGKTTAIRHALQGFQREAQLEPAISDEGWFYLYASPRITINSDQFLALSKPADGHPTLCLTSNSALAAAVLQKSARPRGFAYVRGATKGLQVRKDLTSSPPLDRVVFLDHGIADSLEREAEESSDRRYDRLSNERVVAKRAPQQPVLQALAKAARHAWTQSTAFDRMVLAVSLQALSHSDPNALDYLVSDGNQFDPSCGSLSAFVARFPLFVVMLDEITADESSSQTIHMLRGWLERVLIAPFQGRADAPRVVLFLSDASLLTPAAIAQVVRPSDMPARVLVEDRPSVPPEVWIEKTTLAIGAPNAAADPCAIVHGNAYPANTLNIGYRMIVTTSPLAKNETLEATQRSVAERRRDVLLDRAVELLRRELERPGEQVLCFLQSKRLLDQLRHRVIDELGVAENEILRVTADTSVTERAILSDPEKRDALRIVLMTSSGTRGISFPRADRLLALLPPYAPEQTLLELVQFVYRGRGGDGDARDRRIEIVALDVVDGAEDREDPNLARRHADLAAFLLTVRAAIHTRIFGAYTGSRLLAVMPVGRGGTEQTWWHLQHVLYDLDVAGNRYGTEPRVVDLRAAARQLLGSVRYVNAYLPHTRPNLDAVLTAIVPLLNPGVQACGPVLVVASELTDDVTISEAETSLARKALASFFAEHRDDPKKYSTQMLRAAGGFQKLVRIFEEKRGRQELVGNPFRAQVVVPLLPEIVAESLQRVASRGDSEHQAWQEALEAWIALMAGTSGLRLGGLSHRYEGVPFLVLPGDIDLTGLGDLGRRGIVRAGAVLNVLAGLVLSRPK